MKAKGLLALLVFTHHIYQVTSVFSGTYIGYVFQAFGYWAVAAFFFLSGYGLTISHLNKGNDYTKSLLIKKVAPFYTINALLVGIYCLVNMAKASFSIELSTVLQSFLFGKTIVGNGWYLQVQILLYIFFFISFLNNNEKKSKIILVFLCFAYIVAAKVFGMSETWYVSIPAFVAGSFFAFPQWRALFSINNANIAKNQRFLGCHTIIFLQETN